MTRTKDTIHLPFLEKEWLVTFHEAAWSWRAAGASGSCGCGAWHDELFEGATLPATVTLAARGPDDSTG